MSPRVPDPGSDPASDPGSDPASGLAIPRGDLVRSRVVADLSAVLATALDREFTGYAVLEPGSSLLLGGDVRGVLTFEAGVPVLAYCDATDRGGIDALADLSPVGPCAVDLYALPRTALAEAHDTPSLRVPPGMPAADLARDHDLAERTRAAAPAARRATEPTALEAFLGDGERIADLREAARREARKRAAEWGLADELVSTGDDEPPGDSGDVGTRNRRGADPEEP